MASSVTTAADGLGPTPATFGSPSSRQLQFSASGRGVAGSSWPHAPLMAAAFFYQSSSRNSLSNAEWLYQSTDGRRTGSSTPWGEALVNRGHRSESTAEEDAESTKNVAGKKSSRGLALEEAAQGLEADCHASKSVESQTSIKLSANTSCTGFSAPRDFLAAHSTATPAGNHADVSAHPFYKRNLVGELNSSRHPELQSARSRREANSEETESMEHGEGLSVRRTWEESQQAAAAVLPGELKVKSKLSPQVPEFIPATAKLKPGAGNQKQTATGSSQRLSPEVPEFVPLSLAASLRKTSAAHAQLSPSETTAVVQGESNQGGQAPFTISSSAVILSGTAMALSPATSRGFQALSASSELTQGLTAARAPLSHTSPSFTPSSNLGAMGSTILTVPAPPAGAAASHSLTAVLLPDTVLDGSNLLLSSAPLDGQGLGPAVARTVPGIREGHLMLFRSAGPQAATWFASSRSILSPASLSSTPVLPKAVRAASEVSPLPGAKSSVRPLSSTSPSFTPSLSSAQASTRTRNVAGAWPASTHVSAACDLGQTWSALARPLVQGSSSVERAPKLEHKQHTPLVASSPSSVNCQPGIISSRLSSTSPSFSPSGVAPSSKTNAAGMKMPGAAKLVVPKRLWRGDNSKDGPSPGCDPSGRGFPRRSVSLTASAEAGPAGSATERAAQRAVRVVVNANDSSRLSPTAPAFTPSSMPNAREEPDSLAGIVLPPEETLLEEALKGPTADRPSDPLHVDVTSRASPQDVLASSPLSPAAPAFTPLGISQVSEKALQNVRCGKPNDRGLAPHERAPPETQKFWEAEGAEFQILVDLVKELSMSRASQGGREAIEQEELGRRRVNAVERLRLALLRHLAQQAPTELEEKDGEKEASRALDVLGGSVPSNKIWQREGSSRKALVIEEGKAVRSEASTGCPSSPVGMRCWWEAPPCCRGGTILLGEESQGGGARVDSSSAAFGPACMKDGQAAPLERSSSDPSVSTIIGEQAQGGPGLSAAAKEFVPSAETLVAALALLDPDTVSTSACDPLLILEGLASSSLSSSRTAASRGTAAFSSKSSSRFFPASSSSSPTSRVDDGPSFCLSTAALSSTSAPASFSLQKSHDASSSSSSSQSSLSNMAPSTHDTQHPPWKLAALTSIRTGTSFGKASSPPGLPAARTSVAPPGTRAMPDVSGERAWSCEQDGQGRASSSGSLVSTWASFFCERSQSEERDAGATGMPAISLKRLAELLLLAESEPSQQSPHSHDLPEIGSFLPPDLLELSSSEKAKL